MTKPKPTPTRASAVSLITIPEDTDGFAFASFPTTTYDNMAEFAQALDEQKEATAVLSADCLHEIQDDGSIRGTNLKLSDDAFNDICHLTRTPSGFMRALSGRNMGVAMDAVSEMINGYFPHDNYRMIVDERTNIVGGFIANTARPLATRDLLSYATESEESYDLSQGWISGPHSRFTVLSPKSEHQPRKGDIVRHGISMNNSMCGDASTRVSGYFERLICTNGMVRMDQRGSIRVRHNDDASYQVQNALGHVLDDMGTYLDHMTTAAQHLMLPHQVDAFCGWVSKGANGGSAKLNKAVCVKAIVEARDQGLQEGEVTLWNMINAINAQAHFAPTLTKRTRLEATAMEALATFTPEFCQN